MAARTSRPVPAHLQALRRFGRMSTDAQLVHYGLVSLADLHGRHHADTWSRDLFVAFNHLPESRLEAAIGENVAAGWMQSYEAEGAPWIWLPHTDALHEPGYVRHKRGASSCPTPPGYLDPRAGGVIQSGVLDEALRSERLGVGSGRGRRAGWRLLPHRLFHDERHLELSPTAQRVHCGLRTMVDLHGAYTADRWTLRWLFRLEAAELEAALDELVALGWVELYAGAQGSALWLPDHDGLYGAAVASKRGRPVYGTPPRPGEESGVNEGHSGVNVDHSGVNARPAAPAPAAVVELPDPFCRAAAPESSRVQSGVKPPAVRRKRRSLRSERPSSPELPLEQRAAPPSSATSPEQPASSPDQTADHSGVNAPSLRTDCPPIPPPPESYKVVASPPPPRARGGGGGGGILDLVVELVAGFYDAVHGGVPPGPPHRSDVAAVAQLLHDGWEPDAVRHLWRYAAARVAEGSPAVGRPAGAVSMYGPPAGAAWRARSSPAPSESGVNAAPVRQLELERWKREQERARDLELDARVREELHRHVRGGWAFDADVVVTGRAGDALEVLARDRAVVDVLSGGQYAEAWDATAAAVGARRVRFVVPAGAVA